MKNIIFKSTALAAVMAMTMSGCSNEELTSDNDQPEKVGISTITLGTPPSGPSTRLEYNTDNISTALGVKWKAGKWVNSSSDCEKALCVNAGYTLLYGKVLARTGDGEAASKAEFTFCNPNLNSIQPAYPGSVGLLYPSKTDYSEAFNITGGDNKSSVEATLPLSGQTGRLADMQNFDYMTAMAAVPENTQVDTELNMTFKHRIAVMRLTGLTFPTGTSGAATSVSISGTGLKTDAKLTFTKGANNTLTESLVVGATDGTIATTGSFGITSNVMEDVYICFFPGNTDANGSHEITALKVTATVGGETYEYDYSNDATVTTKITKFVEGKMYTLTGKAMTK